MRNRSLQAYMYAKENKAKNNVLLFVPRPIKSQNTESESFCARKHCTLVLCTETIAKQTLFCKFSRNFFSLIKGLGAKLLSGPSDSGSCSGRALLTLHAPTLQFPHCKVDYPAGRLVDVLSKRIKHEFSALDSPGFSLFSFACFAIQDCLLTRQSHPRGKMRSHLSEVHQGCRLA